MRLHIHHHRTLLSGQDVIRDVLAGLPLPNGLQQERLDHDAAYGRIEVGEEQARQFQARLVDQVSRIVADQ
ncbi:hypothetical protein [Streptomyces kebangsaanensis]|uniref:hypothetical protein n=1 Tax=Streptomyces kebangsaanensis TaxID=864058 RepID=UPI001F18D35A|nr:hypothetical protein [Streptomyces kebangsaanensis]